MNVASAHGLSRTFPGESFVHHWSVGLRLKAFVLGLAFILPGVAGTAYAQGSATRPSVQTVVGYSEAQGRLVKITMMVASKPGTDPATVAAQALRTEGASATPPSHLVLPPDFSWGQFFDRSPRNNVVTQYYNPDGDPTGNFGMIMLQQAQATWSSVKGSSFRFAFGGTTTRCPSLSRVDCGTGTSTPPEQRVADGFNDIAWVPALPDPDGNKILWSIRAGSNANGDVTEIDIVINRDISPFTWFTDGINGSFDLLSTILEVEGIAMGLGGTFDPDSVLFVANDGLINRTLSAFDVQAVLALYPKHPSLLVDTPSAHNYSLIAKTPDFPTLGGRFQAGAINSRGDVAFVAIPPFVPIFPLTFPDIEGLFINSQGVTTEVVRGETNFAGIDLGQFALHTVGLNDTGDVAFCWLVGPFEFPFGVNGGLFRTHANGRQEAVVLPGVTPAPGGGVFVGCYAVTISNGGDVAFTGWVQRESAPLEEGAFLAQSDGTIVRIAGKGDEAPGGGVFSSAAFPRTSPNGHNVAFDATLEGQSVFGIYLYSDDGRIELLARPGDTAAGGGEIVDAIQPRVNDSGDVVYAAKVPGPSGELAWSLFLAARDGSTQAVVRAGDLLPDGFHFEDLVRRGNSWSLNNKGEVAFVARALSPPISFLGETLVLPETGIYVWSQGRRRFVAREGSFVSGVGVLTSVAPESPETSAALINARGDVVFGASVDFGATHLLRARRKTDAN